MKDVLGGKGAGLAEMTTIGIPVPPGFTIASSLCLSYLDSHQFPKRLQVQVENALHRVEAATGKHFGDGDNPLLVSVRSGAAVSMPGMMETILNLGLNDVTVEGLTRQSRNPRFAWDSYRRFVQMYGSVVFDLSRKPFEQILEEHRQRCRVERDIDLPVEEMQAHRATVQGARARRRPAATSPTIRWTSSGAPSRPCSRAGTPGAPSTTGSCTTSPTAWAPPSTSWRWCSATWARTRAPASPSPAIRPPASARSTASTCSTRRARTWSPASARRCRSRRSRTGCPASYQELERVARTLERHFRDVQDMEFTIERGTLYMLQTRRGQRSGHAAVRIACEMVDEELISEEEAVARIPPHDLNQLLHPDHRSRTASSTC